MFIRPSSFILFKDSKQTGYFCDWIITYILSFGSRLSVKVCYASNEYISAWLMWFAYGRLSSSCSPRSNDRWNISQGQGTTAEWTWGEAKTLRWGSREGIQWGTDQYHLITSPVLHPFSIFLLGQRKRGPVTGGIRTILEFRRYSNSWPHPRLNQNLSDEPKHWRF